MEVSIISNVTSVFLCEMSKHLFYYLDLRLLIPGFLKLFLYGFLIRLARHRNDQLPARTLQAVLLIVFFVL